jgi:hypothetical protein
MKLLVATTKTQGDKKNDFNWLPNGEYVVMGMVCDTDRGDPDGGCGCGRAFEGIDHLKSATTAEVVEVDFDRAAWVEMVRLSKTKAGWAEMDNFDDFYTATADEMIELVRDLPAGTVVGRRIDDLVIRKQDA